MMRITRTTILTALVGVALTAGPAAAQEPLVEAQALYANAQYEEALASLNKMRASGLTERDVPPVEQYRALCLLALGRAAEAEEAIAAVMTVVPSYAPPDRDVSPRVRSAFHDVRRRVVPGVIQQKYGEAKAAFERKEYTAARDGFAQVMTVLADPGLADLAGQPPLADLTLLAKGFHDLSVTSLAAAAAPPPASMPTPSPAPSVASRGLSANAAKGAPGDQRTTPVAPPAPTARVSSAGAASGDEGGAVIYSPTDPQVVPPVTVRQALPPYPRRPLMAQQGVVEVVINERGTVESAAMRQSVDQVYDTLAVAAARTWQYKPATRDGVPVKYRKGVQIRIQP
jgi:TonB family protein